MVTGELKSQIDRIWDAFASGGLVDASTVIQQLTFLLFLKRMDELQLLQEKQSSILGTPLENPTFTSSQQELRWNSFKNKDPQTMFDYFTKPLVENMTIFDHMKSMGSSVGPFAEFMEGATFMIGTPRLLDQVVQLIDNIDMSNRDTKGDIYEYMLGKIASAGRNGQFRTPRHIIKMMVELMRPRVDDIVCDPAAGTCGFLVGTSEYFTDHPDQPLLDKANSDHFHNKMFHAIENDPSMARIGAMNLQMHGIANPSIQRFDALSEDAGYIEDEYSLILANPPFKGSLDYDAVESSILQTVKSKKTELLFLGLFLRMLKTGGRCACIVPDGVLFGSSKAHKQIRQELLENHKVHAVISMPSGVFKPYAGVSTAIIIFTKIGNGGTDNVWFYDMQADGYSLDDKRNIIKDNDIPDIIGRYHNLKEESNRVRTDQSFLVPLEEIRDNDWDLSINRYKEIVYEEIEYAPPSEIIKDIETLDQQRNQALAALKEMLR